MQKKTHVLNLAVSLLTLFAIAGTALAGSPASVQASSPGPSKYFYLVSALDGSRYIDIQNARTDPGKTGIPIITHKKNYPASANQLWQFTDDKEKDGYSYIQSRSKTKNGALLVLDIQKGRTDPGKTGIPLVAFTKNPQESANQVWKLVSDGLNGGNFFYLESKSNLVIDISGSNTTADIPLVAFSQNKILSPNQIWTKVDFVGKLP